MTEIINAYIVCDLDTCQNIPLNNFRLKSCLFGATNIAKNNFKKKWMYSGYKIAFDGAGSWSFGYDDARNVVIFGVDNSSSSQDDKCKNSFFNVR